MTREHMGSRPAADLGEVIAMGATVALVTGAALVRLLRRRR
jgi:hypothetical protein